jgi:putative FmdB family regulatory protein
VPVYEYACEKCGYEFEAEQRITEAPLKTCPRCKARKVKRLISQTSFVLKGGGWYADLYASKSGKGGEADKSGKGAEADKKDAPAKSDAAGESTPAPAASGSDTAASESKPKPKGDGKRGKRKTPKAAA